MLTLAPMRFGTVGDLLAAAAHLETSIRALLVHTLIHEC
jgi:hypothetical protein